jgi:hypothetical protein
MELNPSKNPNTRCTCILIEIEQLFQQVMILTSVYNFGKLVSSYKSRRHESSGTFKVFVCHVIAMEYCIGYIARFYRNSRKLKHLLVKGDESKVIQL